MEIVTERLVLREIESDDWPEVLAYQSDPRYLDFYPWTDRQPDDVKDFVEMLVGLRRQRP